MLRKDVENVLECTNSIRQAALYYNVPRTTLRRHNTEAEKGGISTVCDQIQLHG